MSSRSWAISAAFALVPAAAQTLPPVTVTATRTEANPFDVPASVSVAGGDDIRAASRPEVNLAESLATIPGIAARDRQNFAQDLQLSIRGFGARSTFGVRGLRIYVDGIPATMPDGQGQLSHIDLASVGKVEVLRGPFSALYGNSSGGVMQVTTAPGDGTPRVAGSLIAGSNGLLHPGLSASGSTQGLRYAISANHLESDGSRDHSSVSRDVGNARLDFEPAPGRTWTLVSNSVDLRADDPLGLTRAQFVANPRGVDPSAIAFDPRKTVRQEQVGAIHEAKIDPSDTLRVMAYAGERKTVQFQAIPVSAQSSPLHPGGVIGLSREYVGTDLRWTQKRDAFEWVAGLSLDTMGEHRQGWQNFVGSTLGVEGALRRDEDNRVTNVDPYVQGIWKPMTAWTISAGVRHSSVRFSSHDHYIAGTNGDDSGGVSYSATLPVLATMLAISRNLHAYASFGRGFETPTFNELAYRPSGAPGLNFALKPSHSNNVEAGLKGRGDNYQWNAAVFETRTSDELVTQTNSGGRSTFQNAGSTRRRGVELDGIVRLPHDWKLQAAQTWLAARYLHTFQTCASTPCTTPSLVVPAGNRIPGTSNAFSTIELAWEPERGWRGGAELRHSGRVFVNDANSEAASPFTTLALHLGYVFDVARWRIASGVRVDNVADRRYAGSVIVNESNGRYYESAPGRTFTAKVTAAYRF